MGLPAPGDGELWKYLQDRGDFLFRKVEGYETAVDREDWKVPLKHAFEQILKASGHNSMPFDRKGMIRYTIIDAAAFNAAALPNGHIVINSGTLDQMDAMSKEKMKSDGKVGINKGLNYYREHIVAPLIAHELAHYFNRHLFISYKKYLSKEEIDANFNLENIAYSHEQELDADMTAALWLGRIKDYGAASLVDLINHLNGIEQKERNTSDVKAENKKGSIMAYKRNHYLSTHPTPHRRLAAIDKNEKVMHEFHARLEIAFDDIQFGRNLDDSINVLKSAIEKYPSSPYLLKAKAIALHKKWLTTATLDELCLKPIITMPLYRDNMTFEKSGSHNGQKGLNRGVGDRNIYDEAYEAYNATFKIKSGDQEVVVRLLDHAADVDMEFLSYYATFLCFSENATEVGQESVRIAEKAKKGYDSVTTSSNYALVKYLSTQDTILAATDEAIQLFSDIITKISARIPEEDKEYIKNCQLLDEGYVYDNATPVLNYALLLSYAASDESKDANLSKKAAGAARDYIKKYDSISKWARYLAGLEGITIPTPPKNIVYPAVRGLRVNTPINKAKEVVLKWKEKYEEFPGREYQQWRYDGLGLVILIKDGFVDEVSLTKQNSPRVDDKYGVGMNRAEIEKVLGKPTGAGAIDKKTDEQSYSYGIWKNIKVTYDGNNIARNIYIERLNAEDMN